MTLFAVGFVCGLLAAFLGSFVAVVLLAWLDSEPEPDDREEARERLKTIGYK